MTFRRRLQSVCITVMPLQPGSATDDEPTKTMAAASFGIYELTITSNFAIIPKPLKVADMVWIVKHFQTLLMSGLIADNDTRLENDVSQNLHGVFLRFPVTLVSHLQVSVGRMPSQHLRQRFS